MISGGFVHSSDIRGGRPKSGTGTGPTGKSPFWTHPPKTGSHISGRRTPPATKADRLKIVRGVPVCPRDGRRKTQGDRGKSEPLRASETISRAAPVEGPCARLTRASHPPETPLPGAGYDTDTPPSYIRGGCRGVGTVPSPRVPVGCRWGVGRVSVGCRWVSVAQKPGGVGRGVGGVSGCRFPGSLLESFRGQSRRPKSAPLADDSGSLDPLSRR